MMRRAVGVLYYLGAIALGIYLVYRIVSFLGGPVAGTIAAIAAGIWVVFMIATVIGEIWFDE